MKEARSADRAEKSSRHADPGTERVLGNGEMWRAPAKGEQRKPGRMVREQVRDSQMLPVEGGRCWQVLKREWHVGKFRTGSGVRRCRLLQNRRRHSEETLQVC